MQGAKHCRSNYLTRSVLCFLLRFYVKCDVDNLFLLFYDLSFVLLALGVIDCIVL